MGQLCKLILWFKRPFWPPFGFLAADGLVPAWWPVYLGAEAVLMGYCGGPSSQVLAGMGENAAVHQALDEVISLFGRPGLNAFVKGQLVDWSHDPWAQGGYSYTPVGAGDVRAVLSMPVAGTLFFAGEATCTNGHAATVHGAIESGRRAAEDVLETN